VFPFLPKIKGTISFSFVKYFLPKDNKAEKESPPEADLPMEEKLFHFSATNHLFPYSTKAKSANSFSLAEFFFVFHHEIFPLSLQKFPFLKTLENSSPPQLNRKSAGYIIINPNKIRQTFYFLKN
jgi:hypothetical protein